MNCLSCDVVMPELLEHKSRLTLKVAHLECDAKLLIQDRERIMGERDMAIKVAKMLIAFSDNAETDQKTALMILEQLEAKQKGSK